MHRPEQAVTPIEVRKRSNLGAIYGTYLLLWLAAFGGYLCITDSGDEITPPWMLAVFVGKSTAFWCVCGLYRLFTLKRPRVVSVFCGSCQLNATFVFERESGGYEFQCRHCDALNIIKDGG